MKPASLGIPGRDIGQPSFRPFGEALLVRLDEQNRRIADLEEKLYGRKPPAPPLAAERALLDRLDSRTGDAVTLERSRIRDRALDEKYFWIEMEPAVGGLLGASVIDATNFTYEDFPAASTNGRRRSVRRLDLWPRTLMRLHLWYTSPVGSTNLFSVRFNLRQLDTPMVVTAPALVSNNNFTVPGPAVLNTVLYATYAATVAVLPALRLCEFSFLRVGPDANANDFRFIFAAFELREAA